MNSAELVLRNGDVFHWRFKDSKRNCAQYAYWCMSRIALVSQGVLRDTYYMDGKELPALDSIILEYQGNLNDCTTTYSDEAEFYKREDYIDMAHANNSDKRIYLKAGVMKCPTLIYASLQRNLQEKRATMNYARREVERLEQGIAELLTQFPEADSEFNN